MDQKKSEKEDAQPSLQHLFTLGSKDATESAPAGDDNPPARKIEARRFALTDEAPPDPELIVDGEFGAVSDEEDNDRPEVRNRLENFFRPRRDDDAMEVVESGEQEKEEVVDDIHGLAMSFWVGDANLDELREEWFKEGGVKDRARLDFKRRRKQALKNKGIL